eukprot:917371-Prymnesium_polylepis.2
MDATPELLCFATNETYIVQMCGAQAGDCPTPDCAAIGKRHRIECEGTAAVARDTPVLGAGTPGSAVSHVDIHEGCTRCCPHPKYRTWSSG